MIASAFYATDIEVLPHVCQFRQFDFFLKTDRDHLDHTLLKAHFVEASTLEERLIDRILEPMNIRGHLHCRSGKPLRHRSRAPG
jgi:hypothetical protein